MRLKDIELEEKKEGNLSIDLNDEYTYMDFYRRKESKYNYIKRKYDRTYTKSGDYVGLYENESEKRGYFYVVSNILLKEHYIYPAYTRYMELLEFGFNNNNLKQVKFLINYLYYYCRTLGGTFLKIKTKEKDFEEFYKLIREFKHTVYNGYIYVDLDPIDYEFARHLRLYKGDKVNMRDLYFLHQIGFDVCEDKCRMEIVKNHFIEVDRKTKKITYPSYVQNLSDKSKYSRLNEHGFTLIRYMQSKRHWDKDTPIYIDYKIEGVEHELIKVGNRLVTFKDFKNSENWEIREAFYDFVKIVKKNTKFDHLDIFRDVYFEFKMFYPHYCLEEVWLTKFTDEYKEKYLEEEEEEW